MIENMVVVGCGTDDTTTYMICQVLHFMNSMYDIYKASTYIGEYCGNDISSFRKPRSLSMENIEH